MRKIVAFLVQFDPLVPFKLLIFSLFIYLFIFWEKNEHTRERENGLTQRHTTTPLKSHDNF